MLPVYKNKGLPQNVESYRSIANLCLTSKIFKKLILKCILEIQELNNIDLTRHGQHGLKKREALPHFQLSYNLSSPELWITMILPWFPALISALHLT